MIKVMVVDDEPWNREELSRMIEESGEFRVVEEAENGRQAIEKLKDNPSLEVVFLDVDMPGLNGVEVASKLADWPSPPLVVFATAYDQYAIEAFEAKAIDYLLKPCEPGRLKNTLERVRETLKMKEGAKKRLVSLDEHLMQKGIVKKIAGRHRNKKDRIVIDPSEVYYFHAGNTEVTARMEDDELIVNATLKDVLARLEIHGFAQTHKAYIVNLDKIRKVSPMFSGNFEITLQAPLSEKIPLSRRYAKPIKEALSGW